MTGVQTCALPISRESESEHRVRTCRPPTKTALKPHEQQACGHQRSGQTDSVRDYESDTKRHPAKGNRRKQHDERRRARDNTAGQSHHHEFTAANQRSGRRQDVLVLPTTV